jgi:hypothetical protein
MQLASRAFQGNLKNLKHFNFLKRNSNRKKQVPKYFFTAHFMSFYLLYTIINKSKRYQNQPV